MIASIRRGGIPGSRALPSFLVLLLVATAFATGCASNAASRPEGLPSGINDTFLDENLDVDAFVERFEGESRAVYAQRHAITNALDLAPGDQVADIGAGTGFFSRLLADAVGRTGRVYAVEISPRFLEHLRGVREERGDGTIAVVEGTTTSVSLPKDSVDLAFICDVYHHFEDPEASLASLHEAIRPGGSLVLIEFHRIKGVTNDFIYEHVRAGREVFQAEIEAAGFRLTKEIELDGLDDNYVLRFERVD